MLATILLWVFAIIGALGVLTLFLPGLVHIFLWPQNLKKKYGAEWALVTGILGISTNRSNEVIPPL